MLHYNLHQESFSTTTMKQNRFLTRLSIMAPIPHILNQNLPCIILLSTKNHHLTTPMKENLMYSLRLWHAPHTQHQISRSTTPMNFVWKTGILTSTMWRLVAQKETNCLNNGWVYMYVRNPSKVVALIYMFNFLIDFV